MRVPAKVWASNSFIKSQITAPIGVMPGDRTRFELSREELTHWASVGRAYSDALIKDGGVLPKALTGGNWDTRVNKISDFFIGAGFFVVSQRCADVFARFDLGYGGLSPLEIYQGNREALVPGGPFYILYFGCRKQVFVPEASKPGVFTKKAYPREGHTFYSAFEVADDDYALAPAALEGPDLWTDLTTRYSFFMSSRLVQALKAEKVTRTMFLTKCRVLE